MPLPKRILVPVDFSPCSRGALGFAIELAASLQAALEVLHVWEPPQYVVSDVPVYPPDRPPTTLRALAREAAGQEMEQLLKHVAPGRADELGVRIEVGDPLEVILAASGDYDMIVMGTHGRSGLAHLLLGSVAEKVVRRATCPVLTLRVHELPESS